LMMPRGIVKENNTTAKHLQRLKAVLGTSEQEANKREHTKQKGHLQLPVGILRLATS
jgi:hypothetical protein